jgi:hypothetical protein
MASGPSSQPIATNAPTAHIDSPQSFLNVIAGSASNFSALTIDDSLATRRYFYGTWDFPQPRQSDSTAFKEMCQEVGPPKSAAALFKVADAHKALQKINISGALMWGVKNFVYDLTAPSDGQIYYEDSISTSNLGHTSAQRACHSSIYQGRRWRC